MHYDELQTHTLSEAKQLAKEGLEYSHLIKLLSPEYYLRLKLFVQDLPREIADKTIFGKTHWKEQSEARQRVKRSGFLGKMI
jgi:hypothetical protein